MQTLPREEFQDALRKGLGRAVRHVRNSPPEAVRDDLLHACLFNLTYDPQLEESRVPWLRRMIELTGESEFYQAKIFEKYFTSRSDIIQDYDQLQLFRFVEDYAIHGNDEARIEVYRFFDRQFGNPEFNGLSEGEDAIIRFDGIPGLLHVLERFGRKIAEGNEDDVALGPFIVEDAERCLGKSEVQDALRMESERNEFIKQYLENPRTNRETVDAEDNKYRNECNDDRRERIREEYPLREMTDHLLQNDFSRHQKHELFIEDPFRYLTRHTKYKFPISGIWADDEELNYTLDKILSTDDILRKAVLLRTFQNRPLPRVTPDILSWIDSEDENLSWIAMRALSETSHPTIREKALKMITGNLPVENWFEGITILEKSFQPDDFDLLETAIRTKSIPYERLHTVELSLKSICKQNQDDRSKGIYLWLYENGPCSFCREELVEILVEKEWASVELLKECCDDCVKDTQILAAKALMPRDSNIDTQ